MSYNAGSGAMDRDILVLTGATATGKTALGLALARRTGAAIISMDSRQVYRGMDVGTAKVDAADRRAVPHFGLDLVNPDERYSAGQFGRDARRWLAQIRERGQPALLVGGTGFFLRALTHPMFREPSIPAERRDALKAYLATLPEQRLRQWAGHIEGMRSLPGDRQRLSRIIEVATLTGKPLHWWQREAAPAAPALDAAIVVLELDRATLHRRIDARVHEMVSAGFLEEVRVLRDLGYGPNDPGMNATGYREMLAVLAGELSLDDAIARTQAATRAYARRQETWFRHQLPERTVRLDAARPMEELVDRAERILKEEVSV